MTRYLFLFMISVCTLASFQSATAHPYSAKREFFYLKRTAELVNYVENATYVEVLGTTFIGLQSASNERRTCLFGLNRAGLEEPGSFQVHTQFVCFNTGKFQLSMKKEWCEIGARGCEIDPGGISVGIGNLRILEPKGYESELPEPVYDTYPSVLDVAVYEPLRGIGGS